jgi:acyl-CoA thioesterase I
MVVHRARDGARVRDLLGQLHCLPNPPGPATALVTIGGNDLLAGLAQLSGPADQHVAEFTKALNSFLDALPVRPVLLGNVYDPTFGDDTRNFLGTEASVARENHCKVNELIAAAARRLGPGQARLVDLHAHFLKGDPSWFVMLIEPSLTGASEIRRAFLSALLGSRT